MKLTRDDREQLKRYATLEKPSPEAEAFLLQLPHRVRRRVIDVIIEERRRVPVDERIATEASEGAIIAMFPDGLSWRDEVSS